MTKKRTSKKYVVAELYAGTARSAEAFRHWSRARIGLLVDNDSFAFETYLQNYSDAPYAVRSLSCLQPHDIENLAGGRVDILLGCPPCQGFSDTGLRELSDRRNTHLTHFARIASQLRPLAVAMENVPLAGNTIRFAHFVERMERSGYRSTWGVLNAALHGSTQCRHRLVYVGIRNDVRVEPVFPKPTHGSAGVYWSYCANKLMQATDDRTLLLRESPGARAARARFPYHEELLPLGFKPIPTLAELWDGLPKVGTKKAREMSHLDWAHTRAMRLRMGRVPEGGRWRGGKDHFSHSYGRLHRRGLAPTLTTYFSNPGSGRFWHPVEDRAISLREAARIQGIPDSFALFPEPKSSSRLIGNALDARLAQATYEVIRDCLS